MEKESIFPFSPVKMRSKWIIGEKGVNKREIKQGILLKTVILLGFMCHRMCGFVSIFHLELDIRYKLIFHICSWYCLALVEHKTQHVYDVLQWAILSSICLRTVAWSRHGLFKVWNIESIISFIYLGFGCHSCLGQS